VTPPLEELAEDTAVYLMPRAGVDRIDRGDCVFDAGPLRAAVCRIRLGDVEAAVEWTRREARSRGVETVEWWVGWHAEPADLGERLLALGLEPDDPPALTGMTCATAPPPGPADVDVRLIETIDEQLAALEIDWDVWSVPEADRVKRRAIERDRFEALREVSQHYTAYLDGNLVGFGRGEFMAGGIALMGGAVLPEARGHGVYRALVHARWEHAVRRGTPLLVVQAGPMSGPILTGLGFESHGELRLYVDQAGRPA
jgi:GNAT superfamily N-acetyltransferase